MSMHAVQNWKPSINMSKNNKTWQSEVIETEDWNKLIKKENALIGNE